MRNWMKQLNRVIVLALVVVCLFGYLGLEARAKSENNGISWWDGKWEHDGVGWWYNTDTGYPAGGWRQVWDGSSYYWYYFDSGGYLKTKAGGAITNGWIEENGIWYYVETSGSPPTLGKMKTGWQKIGGADYYFNSSGHMVTDDWYNGYWLGSDGKMATSTWVDGEEYYVDSTGKYVTGWLSYKGHWYFLNDGTISGYEKGQMIAPSNGGWVKVGSYYYYFYAGGQLATGQTDGWLPIGSNWYMLKTTGATKPEDGLYSRMTKWVQVGSDRYYFDSSSGVMKTSSFVPSTSSSNDSNAYVDSEGKQVYDAWIVHGGNDYYIGANGLKVTNDWKNGYYLGDDGRMLTNCVINDPDDGGKQYYVGADGKYVYDQVVTVGTTNYYAKYDGSLVQDIHLINPYYDICYGGLYNDNDNSDLKYAKNVYSTGAINPEYTQLSIGANPAASMTVSIPNGYISTGPSAKWQEWDDGVEDKIPHWVWDDAINGQAAVAWASNRSALCNGGMYAIYRNIATLNGQSVDLKMSIVDYATLYGWGEEPVISFSRTNGRLGGIPGILAANISWVQVKYELFYSGTNTLIPDTTKGNTTYYDVDSWQSICFNGNTDKGIYCSGSCVLRAGEVTSNGVLNGNCVFFDSIDEADETDESTKPTHGVTEIFQGNTLIRTFSLKSNSYKNYPDDGTNTVQNVGAARGVSFGAIYNDGNPVPSGNLTISKTILPAQNKDFAFTIVLKNGNANIDLDAAYVASGAGYSSVAFTDGRATVTLSHGESVTIKGIPAGLTYTVTETQQSGFVADSATASGTIAIGGTATAAFTNRQYLSLTVKKTVKGNMAEDGKTFDIAVTIKKPDGTVHINETLKLAHDGSKTYNNIPAGYTYTVDEADYSGEGYSVTGEVSNATLLENETVTVTNTQEERTLTVDKVVNGTDAAKNLDFEFTLNVWYADGTQYIKDRKFTLKDGDEPFSIDLPKNAKYTITETENTDFITTVTPNGVGEQVLEENADVVFTNRELLDLTVKKVVAGVTGEKDRDFRFTVSYTKPDGTTGSNEFTLKDGQTSEKIILPYGATYSVTEADVEGYDTTGEVTNATLNQDTTVTVTNSAKEYELAVEKVVVGDTNAQSKEFTFTLAVTRQSGIQNFTPKTYVKGGKTYSLGEGNTFALKHGETATVAIPEGWTYTVTETNPGEDYTNPVYSDVNHKVTVTNTQLIPLTLTKLVSGNMGETEREFVFTVSVDGDNREYKLKHEDSETIQVPYGATYTITETDYSGEGYKTTISGAENENEETLTASGTIREATTVTFENTKGFSIPTGMSMAVLPFLGMVLFGGGIGITQLLGGRKSRRGRYLDR